MKANHFYPQKVSKVWLMKERRMSGQAFNFNFQSRVQWYPAGFKSNRQGILRRWQQIHHYASHAPWCLPHWKAANELFQTKFFGSNGNASMRYLNTYSAHSWL